jgi:peptidyl-prolyl cis-trans isomerase SurA
MRSLLRSARVLSAPAVGLLSSLLLATAAWPEGAVPAVDTAAPPPAAPAAPAPLTERVIASVNDDIISTYDLDQRMRLLIVTAGIQPTNDNIPEIEREALSSLIDERLELQELKREEKEQKFTIIATDADVDDEVADIAKQNNTTPGQLLASLAQQGVGADTFRGQLRAEISWQRWIRGRYGSRLRIGEDQIKAFQQRVAAEANKPKYLISEVLIDTQRAGGAQQAVNEATQLIAQLHQGAPFQAVARQFSSDSTAANGGNAGWVTPGQFPPEVDAALEQMRPSTLSAPIPTKDGVYIIYLQEKQAGGGAMLISLKQAAIALAADATQDQMDAAKAKLEALKPQLHGCDNFETIAAKADGVVAGDLGEADVKDLAPAFKDAALTLQIGQVSEPLRSDQGLHLIAVCNKRTNAAQGMDRDEIENLLFGKQLSMISKRYVRDLRNSADIETR